MYIEIVAAPDGESPQWVRDAWIGLRVKALNEQPVDMRTAGVLSSPKNLLGQVVYALRGKTVTKRGYVVKASEVIGLLALTHEDAARWWIDNVPQATRSEQVFLFEERCCRVIRIH
jgi:hypothetical protein